LLEGHIRRSRLFYPTADNNSWYRNPTPFAARASAWRWWPGLGDVSWSLGNRNNPALGLLVRKPPDSAGLGRVIDFGVSVPDASIGPEGGRPIYCEKGPAEQGKDGCAGG